MIRRLMLLLAVCLSGLSASAQMTFTFRDGATFESETNTVDGSTTYTVPAGTNLSGLITAVQVDGTTVTPSQIKPNPTTTLIESGELEVFTYNNKAYGFRFVEDVWFCAVFISDCHTNQGNSHDGTSVADLTTITNNIIAMGQDGTKKVTFTGVDGLPSSYVPKTSIVFCLGDIDQDKGDDGSTGTHTNFLGATADIYKTAKIPFIFIAGNHDFSPDYWGSSNSDKGVTYGSTGGNNADNKTISAITNNNSYWSSYFDSDGALTYFTTGNSRSFEPSHFTFKYKDVRFYCANNYWFQKPHSAPGLLTSATYYAPDPIISNLSTFVDNHSTEASVWMQHYSFLAGSDINRWWLDQNEGGYYITATGSSNYGSCTSNIAYNDATSANTLKKDPISAIMAKTAGKVDGKVQHFSGHYHQFADNTYTSTVASANQVHDYTVAANGNTNQSNNAYVVLMKRGEGVKAVVQTQF